MSYSRRQLYALGETFGECATRKEGGRIIYGGGGSPSQPEKQTTVQDLPDWAKPAAQRTVAKAEAITSDRPYQSYGNWAQSRGMDPSQVAGFTGLQKASFAGAENLTPASSLAPAQDIAGMAGIRALNTRYNPYQTGGFGQVAGDYMSPFIAQSLQPQLRELSRQSEIQRGLDSARAVGQGAFGGSRQAIVDAERERNLSKLQQDVLDRGYQQAFDRAQQQFNTEQQLREQSRQFGMNARTQGLQTALQAAGQMGQLGGQEFAQTKDVLGLQNAMGTQQQQLEQAKINANMQDYAAEQRYPLQQLEFMSNLLRGTPMGTVQTLYAPPPSMMGQIAGIGAGLYGMSQMKDKFGAAGGGLMESYAEGGVTSDQNVESILNKLSDAQLQQARQIAVAERDTKRVQMIDAEMAERASIKGGLGGAFNMLPQEQQNAVTEMADGGIVAFAGGGDIEHYQYGGLTPIERARMERLDAEAIARMQERGLPTEPVPAAGLFPEGSLLGMAQRSDLFPEGSLLGKIRSSVASDPAAQQAIEAERAAREAGVRAAAAQKARTAEIANYPAGVAPMVAPQPTTQTYTRTGGAPAPEARPEAKAKLPVKAPKGSGLQAAAQAVGAAAEATTGVKRTSMEDAFKQGMALIRDEQGEADSKRMIELINKISKVDSPDKMELLANFGFKMAAAASKSGARFLGAAAEGAQVVPEALAQYRKDQKEANKLAATLEMEKLRHDAAVRKGDRTAAMQHAANIRIMEGQEAQLAETGRHNRATEKNQAAQIAATEARYRALEGRQGEAMMRVKSAIAQRASTQAAKDWENPLKARELKQQYPSQQAYQKALFNSMWAQAMPTLQYQGTLSEETE